MWRLVLITFVFLGWAFYELSGGADYRPAPDSIQARATRAAPEAGPQPSRVPKTQATGPVVLASTGVPTVAVEPQAERRAILAPEVTLRVGPGKGYGRVARLERHDEVELLRMPGGGWVKLRVAGTGQVGWLPARLLYRPR